MAEMYAPGLGPVMEVTEKEKQEAMRLSAEALERSKAAHQLYLEAYQAWQKTGFLADGKDAVVATWLKYTEAFNDYLGIYQKGGGTLGDHEKPYPQRHE